MVPPNPLPLVKNLALRRYSDLWGGSTKTARPSLELGVTSVVPRSYDG